MTGQLIGSEMAAIMLGCSQRHIQNLVKQGALTNHSGQKRDIRLDVDELTDAIDNGTLKPPLGRVHS